MAEFSLAAFNEWTAHDPFGSPKGLDGEAAALAEPVALRAARGGYVSLRVLVRGEGEYRLAVSAGSGLEADLYRVWYHRMRAAEGAEPEYWPDALVPVRRSGAYRLPDPDNDISGQKVQEFWLDVFVPPDAKPGKRRGSVRVTAGGAKTALAFRVEVLDAQVPEEPCVVMDINSYGSRGMPGNFPKTFGRAAGPKLWGKSIEMLHNYYRVSHEHRTLLHNLGYGHSGRIDTIYAPRPVGSGRERRLGSWDLYDRHYGPLLDGSAFASASPGAPPPRRKASPIWGVYTPINPDWPADYLNWGEAGYEAEFTNCVREMDAHLREKGWTQSRIEFFFNHKKRYRWYEWDGDEQKYAKDNAYHAEMIRMWEAATADSAVNWVYRADASWQMKLQFEELGRHRNFWVCGGFIKWYPDEVREVLNRGETVWWYGGFPPIQMATSTVLQNLWKTWARSLHGFCHWSGIAPGKDPWFDSGGCATGVIYPGERFGIKGPIPSIRLKVLRNGIQDVDLLDAAARGAGRLDAVREELTGQVPIKLWEKPPRAALEMPPEDWDSKNLAAEHEPIMEAEKQLSPQWWSTVRERALSAEV
ncbi:MAG: glycoside hydrolase domain-containing protein [Planctomycetota bacterium]|jgi:hypothetical protein